MVDGQTFDAECSHCHFTFGFEAEHLGKKARCLECKKPVDLVPIMVDEGSGSNRSKPSAQGDPAGWLFIRLGGQAFAAGIVGLLLFTFIFNYFLEGAWDSGKREVSVPKFIFVFPGIAVLCMVFGFIKVAHGLGVLKLGFIRSAGALGTLLVVGIASLIGINNVNNDYSQSRRQGRPGLVGKPDEGPKRSFGVSPTVKAVVVKERVALKGAEIKRRIDDFVRKPGDFEAVNSSFENGTRETQLALISELTGALMDSKNKRAYQSILEQIIQLRAINIKERSRSFQVFAEFNKQLSPWIGKRTIPWGAFAFFRRPEFAPYKLLHSQLFQTAVKDFRGGSPKAKQFIVVDSQYPVKLKLEFLPVEGRSDIRTDADRELLKIAKEIARRQ